jgi:hypothetical protein
LALLNFIAFFRHFRQKSRKVAGWKWYWPVISGTLAAKLPEGDGINMGDKGKKFEWQIVSGCVYCGFPIWVNFARKYDEKPPGVRRSCECPTGPEPREPEVGEYYAVAVGEALGVLMRAGLPFKEAQQIKEKLEAPKRSTLTGHHHLECKNCGHLWCVEFYGSHALPGACPRCEVEFE